MNERDIFTEAMQKVDSAERAAFLDRACGRDEALRRRIDDLIGEEAKLGSFLEAPPSGVVAEQTRDMPQTERLGEKVGPYKLLQQIGEGGMGVVYMAEQTAPVIRRVALKIIKPGMDTRQVIARFEAERQALSLMDHPNIARVLDAGATDSGRPYFVMELVKGQPITQYCDEKHLTPRQRLELLVPVCQAIQHAHQKGIIHRDIKPSNVLVAEYDQQAVPKVIDFGVAKATAAPLTERTMFTGFGQLVGTIEYMSPEQAKVNQLDIDTRSDIYSLGVLMYELLAGSTPFDRQRLRAAAFDEMLRIIREEEPPKPSTRLSESTDSLPSISAQRHTEPARLTKMVRGELDWIVMKALEKDRSRRYETANGLAADLQRYLSDEAVLACPPSAAYRIRKFARRNKGALMTAALVAGALVAGTTVSIWQAIRATNALESERQTRAALDAERTQLNGKIGDKLLQVAALRERARAAGPTDGKLWADLQDTARRAETLTSSELADPALVERVRGLLELVRQDEKNRQMAVRLGEFRFENLAIPPGTFIPRDVGMAAAGAFREYGLPVTDLPVADAAGRIRNSGVRDDLLTGLIVWSIWDVQVGGTGWKRLLTVAQAADDDPWRRECRDAVLRGDFAALTELARREDSPGQPAEAVLLLAMFLVGPPRPEGRAATSEERAAANALLEKAGVWHSADSRIELALAAWFPGTSRVVDKLATARESIKRLTNDGASPETLASAYFNLGQLHANINGKPDKAGVVAACRQAVRLMPDRTEYWAMLITHLDDDDERIAECMDWIQSGPPSPVPYRDRGLAYHRRQRWSEALSDFTKWTEISPQDASAWSWRGSAHTSLSQFDKALAAYTTAIEVATHAGQNPAFYWHGRAFTYQQLREWDKALADSTRAVELDPKNGIYWAFRGDAYRGKGDLQKALADYDMAVVKPGHGNPFIGLERRLSLNKQLGRWDAAISDLTENLKLQPNNVYVSSLLFQLLIECPDPAFRDPRQALELDKENGPLFPGEPDKRRRLLDKAKELMTTQNKEP